MATVASSMTQTILRDAMQWIIKRARLQLKKPYLKGWWSGLHAVPEDGQEVAILARESR